MGTPVLTVPASKPPTLTSSNHVCHRLCCQVHWSRRCHRRCCRVRSWNWLRLWLPHHRIRQVLKPHHQDDDDAHDDHDDDDDDGDHDNHDDHDDDKCNNFDIYYCDQEPLPEAAAVLLRHSWLCPLRGHGTLLSYDGFPPFVRLLNTGETTKCVCQNFFFSSKMYFLNLSPFSGCVECRHLAPEERLLFPSARCTAQRS